MIYLQFLRIYLEANSATHNSSKYIGLKPLDEKHGGNLPASPNPVYPEIDTDVLPVKLKQPPSFLSSNEMS